MSTSPLAASCTMAGASPRIFSKSIFCSISSSSVIQTNKKPAGLSAAAGLDPGAGFNSASHPPPPRRARGDGGDGVPSAWNCYVKGRTPACQPSCSQKTELARFNFPIATMNHGLTLFPNRNDGFRAGVSGFGVELGEEDGRHDAREDTDCRVC